MPFFTRIDIPSSTLTHCGIAALDKVWLVIVFDMNIELKLLEHNRPEVLTDENEKWV